MLTQCTNMTALGQALNFAWPQQRRSVSTQGDTWWVTTIMPHLHHAHNSSNTRRVSQSVAHYSHSHWSQCTKLQPINNQSRKEVQMFWAHPTYSHTTQWFIYIYLHVYKLAVLKSQLKTRRGANPCYNNQDVPGDTVQQCTIWTTKDVKVRMKTDGGAENILKNHPGKPKCIHKPRCDMQQNWWGIEERAIKTAVKWYLMHFLRHNLHLLQHNLHLLQHNLHLLQHNLASSCTTLLNTFKQMQVTQRRLEAFTNTNLSLNLLTGPKQQRKHQNSPIRQMGMHSRWQSRPNNN